MPLAGGTENTGCVENKRWGKEVDARERSRVIVRGNEMKLNGR